ncbi:MAG: FAD-dependent oxidoreductase [Nitrososphaerales archaeon]
MTDKSITDKKLSRRQFVGAAAGGAAALGAGAILAPTFASAAGATPAARSQAGAVAKPLQATSLAAQPSTVPSSWDYQADVVVIGGGGAGLPAAIAAFQAGASVLVVEMNYDVGGHAMMAGGGVYFGAGNSAQIQYGITDSPDLYFSDLTSPTLTYSVFCGTHYTDRSFARLIADNMIPTWDWLLANGVQFTCTALPNTPPSTGSGITWPSGTARTESPYWNGASSFPASAASPGGQGGAGLVRPLEATARAIGVQFLLNYRMTSIIREQPYAGSVLGITAQATGGRFLPGSITPLQPYLTQGNITLENTSVNIRANRAVVIATGGSSSSVNRRREQDPRMSSYMSTAGDPYSFQNGDGEYAARRIGASMWSCGGQNANNDCEIYKPGTIGAQYPHVKWVPASPIFPLARAGGLSVSTADYDGILQVNMAGVRFFNESTPGTGGITGSYAWIDAAMSINAASTPPDYAAGPIWAIFDSAEVTRAGWTPGYPNTDPLFFFQSNTIAGLAQQINSNTFQTTPMDPNVLTTSVNAYNALVAAGKGDTQFGKTPFTNQINTPPYYAAWQTPVVWIWYTGLHINTKAQVMDLDGDVIPNLYAVGDCTGTIQMHGLTKHWIIAKIAGTNAALEPNNIG